MPILYEKAPAKINLTLDVLYKRPDHFHEVEMVMTTVDLADYVGLRLLNQQKILIKTTDSFIPNDQRNLAYQAAKLLMDRFDIKTGVEIDIHKQIPVAAGLAGGSTDAAATLRGLNRLWKLNLSVEELAELGAEIGSDIPFCVHGGTALATGRGEVLKPLSAPPNCWVILAKPAISVSTGNIYGSLTLDEMEHVTGDEPREAPLNVANGAVVPVARAQFHRLKWCHVMLLMTALVNVVTGQMKFNTTFSRKHPVLYTESRRFVPERDVFATFMVRLSDPCQWIPRDSEDAETVGNTSLRDQTISSYTHHIWIAPFTRR